jgi:hypothetical protein
LPCPPLLLLLRLCRPATSGEGGRSSADNPETPLLQLHAALCTLHRGQFRCSRWRSTANPSNGTGTVNNPNLGVPCLRDLGTIAHPFSFLLRRHFVLDSRYRYSTVYILEEQEEASQQASTRPLTAQPSTSLNSIARPHAKIAAQTPARPGQVGFLDGSLIDTE